MDIDELTEAETDPVVDLWQRCGQTRPWNDPVADVAHARRTIDAVVLVGREEAAIIATVMVGFDGHRGWCIISPSIPLHSGEVTARR